MIRRINSNSSHGNDYVLADTRRSQRFGSKWKHLSSRRPYTTRNRWQSRQQQQHNSSVIVEEKLFKVMVVSL